MIPGHVCAADPIDTLHHEKDGVVYSHYVYKSLWSPVTGEQLVLKKVFAINPEDEFAVAVIKNSQRLGSILSEKNIHRSIGTLLHERVLWSVILLKKREKEQDKGL